MKKIGLVLVIVLLITAALSQFFFDKGPAGASKEGEKNFPAATSLLDFLGGVRQYLAYTLFIKNDKLHHTYYGNLAQEQELIPYFILITMLDPYYVDAYYIGTDLMDLSGKKDEAIKFNLQGIEANPDSADLFASLADLYLEEKDYEKAAAAFGEALRFEPHIVSKTLLFQGLLSSYHAMGRDDLARSTLIGMNLYNEIRKYQEDPGSDLLNMIIIQLNDGWSGVFGEERPAPER